MSHSQWTPLPDGFHPFWFWNAALDPQEIRWQVQEMARAGIRGFFVHPRQGLDTPYLSESFFQAVAVALEEAEKHGLILHLYDEYPYPSGVAGGKVLLGNPHFWATRLIQRTYDLEGGCVRLALPRGKVLNCTAYPLRENGPDWGRPVDLLAHVGPILTDESFNETGLTAYNRKRYFASNPTPVLEVELPKGRYRLFVSVQAVVEGHKYWGHFADVLNPEAVSEFLRLTHEEYRRRFGDQFGKRIGSIFVDETAPGWSERLPEAFRAEYGYDLIRSLPALQDRDHPEHLRVAADLYRLRYRLFCESFEEPVARWCRAQGLRYAGEKPSLRLSQLRFMDLPGCDPGHTKAGAPLDILRASIRSNARAVASAAYFYGKEGGLCECYHSLGWSGTLQDAKLIAEGLLWAGIRYLVPHGFFYTTHGLSKHDAPPSFFFQMPYWKLFACLSERVERIARAFEGTHIEAEVLVLDPHAGLPGAEQLRAYERLLQTLAGNQYEFLIVDTEILESGIIENGRVQVRGVSAPVLLLPPMQTVEEPLQRWLEAFERKGGAVLRLELDWEEEALLTWLQERVFPALELEVESGPRERLWVVRRTDGSRRVWFLLNTSDQTLSLTIRHAQPLREVPLDDRLPSLLERSGGRYRRRLAPFESLLLAEGIEGEEKAEGPTEFVPRVRVPVAPRVQVRPLNSNLLRMDPWEMELLGEDGTAFQRATVRAMPLANQLAEGAFRFSPRFRFTFGVMPQMEIPPLVVRYRYRFLSEWEGPCELVLEPGSIGGRWTIQVNERAVLRPEDFRPTDAHVRGSLGAPIADQLLAGENVITVQVESDRLDGGLRNPLYLAGPFGVWLDGEVPRLASRPEQGEYEAWRKNGLPYYAGAVEYRAQFRQRELPPTKQAILELDHGVPFQDALELSVNGGPWRALPWSPYALQLPTAELREGDNVLRLRVYTTLIRAFEGQWFDPVEHRSRDVREGP